MENEKIIAATATEMAKQFCSACYETLSKPIKKNFQLISEDFQTYLEFSYRKNKYVRILSNKATPLKLNDIYVAGSFSCNGSNYSDEEVIQKVRDGEKIIIKGDGGLGKTFFVKKLWGAIFDNPHGRVPIFLSLRDLNELSDLDIKSFIRLNIMSSKDYSEEIFQYFCKTGKFIFIFDGFDEVIEEKRTALKIQLMDIAAMYDECGYLITSRDSEGFNAWESFYEYRVNRFDRKQTLELLSNVPYEESIKKKFLKNITASYFRQHNSFLSNPLLAIMMMITFHENAQVPDKMSTFYENAFQTLYRLHDGLKGAFLRERVLDKDNFRRLFSLFCLYSYYEEQTHFNESEIRNYISRCLVYLKISVPVDGVIKELVESTNLLQLEGLQYSFIHRSFQEYFAAYCVTKFITSNQGAILEVFSRRTYDESFFLSYEIHPDLVEKEFVIPKFNKFKEEGMYPLKTSKSKALYFLNLYDFTLRVNYRVKVSKSDKLEIDSVHYSLLGGDYYKFQKVIWDIYGKQLSYTNEFFKYYNSLAVSSERTAKKYLLSSIVVADLPDHLKDGHITFFRAGFYFEFTENSIEISGTSVPVEKKITTDLINKVLEESIGFNEKLKAMTSETRKMLELLETNLSYRNQSIDKLIEG